jgi:hypothetical protein
MNAGAGTITLARLFFMRRTGTSEKDLSNEEYNTCQHRRAIGGNRLGVGPRHARRRTVGRSAEHAKSGRTKRGAAGQERQSPQGSPSQRGGQAQQGEKEPMQKGPTGQGQQRDQGAAGKAEQDDKAQPQRSGQGQRDQQSPSQAQSPQRQDNQQGGQASQGQAQGAQGSKTLTTEQRTTIRNTVVSKGPRASNVNFNISVGTAVPTSVRVVAVPTTLIKIYPEWRGHMYFVVNDEIIIVDRRHRIIAVLPV